MKYLNYFIVILILISSPLSAKAGGGLGGATAGVAGAGFSGVGGNPLKGKYVASLMLMAEQLSATMIQQAQIIGTFFDAKHQLETQRLFQLKTAEAHKDYHPSEQVCEIGTFVRDLADSQERIKITRNAIQNASFARALGTGDVKTAEDQSSGSDQETRRDAFISIFCDINDNGGENLLLCETNKLAAQRNADINYTQTIDAPLTLNVNLNDDEVTIAEENIFAFLDQIFMNESFSDVPRNETLLHDFIRPYQEMRSLVAMRSVAQNSFAHIIGEKTVGPDGEKAITPYIRSLLTEMGLSANYIKNNFIGENPSYYAQMEILTKKMFQNPEFIANLYDKPANVKRIRAALSAIKLMQDRDIHNALQRREMLTSMILELQLRHKQNDLSNEAYEIIAKIPDVPNTFYGDGSQNSTGIGTYNERTGAGGF